jgi:hypothetical protein
MFRTLNHLLLNFRLLRFSSASGGVVLSVNHAVRSDRKWSMRGLNSLTSD